MPCGMYGKDKDEKMDGEPLTDALDDHKRGSMEAVGLAGMGEEPDSGDDRSIPPLF